MCKKNEFLKDLDLLLNSIEKNNVEYWKKYYKDISVEYIFEDIVIDINEIKRLTDENRKLKKELNFYQSNYGTKTNMLKINKKKLVNMLIASWSRENKIVRDLNNFEDWLEDLWNETQDIWYVKIINKIKEIRGEDINDK